MISTGPPTKIRVLAGILKIVQGAGDGNGAPAIDDQAEGRTAIVVYEKDHRLGEKRIGRSARDYQEFADRQIFGLTGLRGQRTGNQQDGRNESNAVEPRAHICNYITKAGTLRGHAAISNPDASNAIH